MRVTLTAPGPKRACTTPQSSSLPPSWRCLNVYLIGVPSPGTPSTTSRSPVVQLVPLPPAEDFHDPSFANVTLICCIPWVVDAPVSQACPVQVPASQAG